MQIWEAILLGFIQGFTEFLPISSSGHLLLAQKLFKIENNDLFFDIMLHVGTLIPICIVFFKQIKGLFIKPFDRLTNLVIATLPAGIVGILFSGVIDKYFYKSDFVSALLLGIAFLFTGAELIFAERAVKKNPCLNFINKKTSLMMGIAQAIAVVPGISRSGTVISMGCFNKVNRKETADFAFLMSIPIILSSAMLEGIKCAKGGIVIDILPLLFGIISSAISGYVAIKWMLGVIKKANYKWFSLYLVIMAVISIIEGI